MESYLATLKLSYDIIAAAEAKDITTLSELIKERNDVFEHVCEDLASRTEIPPKIINILQELDSLNRLTEDLVGNLRQQVFQQLKHIKTGKKLNQLYK